MKVDVTFRIPVPDAIGGDKNWTAKSLAFNRLTLERLPAASGQKILIEVANEVFQIPDGYSASIISISEASDPARHQAG